MSIKNVSWSKDYYGLHQSFRAFSLMANISDHVQLSPVQINFHWNANTCFLISNNVNDKQQQ